MSPGATTGDVRAAVENLLGTYARLCDERDFPGLAVLLCGAVVTFGDADAVSGPGAVADLFEQAFSAGQRTRHLITNVVVAQPSAGVAVSHAYYTRWVLDPAPTLAGMGGYRSEFVSDEAHWRFTAHTVRRDWFQELPE
ncbi:MAG TPA: nuclear transport factor 2 family protein [Nocardioides sp.]